MQISTLNDPDSKIAPDEPCLFIHAMTEKDVLEGKSRAVSTVLPCKYVTHIGFGPECEIDYGDSPDRIIIMGTAPRATNALRIEQIKASLREFSDGSEPEPI